ncbi:MAG: GIY-YIG nuclease family protein [FCB group bacterium]|nr:GIY-YIG nuclease family protein [FCB group bacterium]
MYYVYILYSRKTNRYYTGSSGDPERRLEEHNHGRTKSTKGGIPWTLVYQIECSDRKAAVALERKIKRMKSRSYIEWLITQG